MCPALLFLVLGLAGCEARLPPIPAVASYFRAAHVRSLVLLLCSTHYDKLKAGKALSREGFMVSYTVDRLISDHQRTGALLDTSCSNYSSLGPRFLGPSVEWLVFGGPAPALPALPDSSVTLLEAGGGLVDLFRPRPGVPMVRTANYRAGAPRRHTDLGGAVLTAAHLIPPTNTNGNPAGDEYEGTFGGLECLDSPPGGWHPNMSLELVETLAEQLNFSLSLIKDRGPGCMGLQRLVQNRSALFSATAIMFSAEGAQSLEFTTQLFQIRSRILYKQPGLSAVKNLYLLPFEQAVWFCSLGTLLVTGGILLLAQRTGGAFEEHFVGSVEILCTLLIGFVSQQGTHLSPKSLTVRMTIVVLSFFALFLYTTYSANIVALLQSSKPTVKSLSQLSSSHLKLLLQDTPYNRDYFKETKDEEVVQLSRKKSVGPKSYTSVNNGVDEIRKGYTAVNMECSAAYKRISLLFAEPEKCGLGELKVFTLPPTSLPMAKDSGYRETFTRMLSRQAEVGLVSRSERKHTYPKPSCVASDGGFVSVGITSFQPALVMLLYGALAALASFLLELLTASVQRTKIVRFKDINQP